MNTFQALHKTCIRDLSIANLAKILKLINFNLFLFFYLFFFFFHFLKFGFIWSEWSLALVPTTKFLLSFSPALGHGSHEVLRYTHTFLVHSWWLKLSPTRSNVTLPVLFGQNAARGSITLSERTELFEKSSPRMSGNLSSRIFDMLTDATAISEKRIENKQSSLKYLLARSFFFFQLI